LFSVYNCFPISTTELIQQWSDASISAAHISTICPASVTCPVTVDTGHYYTTTLSSTSS